MSLKLITLLISIILSGGTYLLLGIETLVGLWTIIIIIKIRVHRRGFFWKAKDGTKLTFKEFRLRWKEGYTNISPVQQTRISLWSFVPIFAGMIWGIVVAFMGGTYWLALILCGSLPITAINFISNLQKFKSQKKVDEVMKNFENEDNKRNRKSKKRSGRSKKNK